MNAPSPLAVEEFRALRATIRERGSQRLWLIWLGFAVWGTLVLASMALALWPIATLLPLLILFVTFESAFAIHTAVERIGRYLQVFHERDGEQGRGWEHQTMAFGQAFPGVGSDPLMAVEFLLATALNFIALALSDAVPIEYGVIGGLHVLFGVRIIQARRQAGRQRAKDLDRFTQLQQRS